MEEAWETRRIEWGYNASPERDKSYPILFVWTKEKKRTNKQQSKESTRPSHFKHYPYAFVYVYVLVQSYL